MNDPKGRGKAQAQRNIERMVKEALEGCGYEDATDEGIDGVAPPLTPQLLHRMYFVKSNGEVWYHDGARWHNIAYMIRGEDSESEDF